MNPLAVPFASQLQSQKFLLGIPFGSEGVTAIAFILLLGNFNIYRTIILDKKEPDRFDCLADFKNRLAIEHICTTIEIFWQVKG